MNAILEKITKKYLLIKIQDVIMTLFNVKMDNAFHGTSYVTSIKIVKMEQMKLNVLKTVCL